MGGVVALCVVLHGLEHVRGEAHAAAGGHAVGGPVENHSLLRAFFLCQEGMGMELLDLLLYLSKEQCRFEHVSRNFIITDGVSVVLPLCLPAVAHVPDVRER